jgi:peptide/nickel transport system ATP-binding protein
LPKRNVERHGSIRFEGKEIGSAKGKEMQTFWGTEMAMVFQDPMTALNPVMRIGKQITESLRYHLDVSKDFAQDTARQLLVSVGIPEPDRRLRQYAFELSGGMRQRVMIAISLACGPKLLFADEPTTALDVTVQAQILDLLATQQRERFMAMILVTHDLGVVAGRTDDIAVMYAGRIVERASAETLFSAPEHPYTWGLLKSIPRLDVPRGAQLVPVPGRPPSLISRPTGCHFHPRCPYVRDAHTRIDPPLEPVPGDPAHLVRCLLPAPTRQALWRELRAGADPEAAREAVGVEETAG